MSEIILEAKNIHKAFDENKIHRGIDLKLAKGESLGLLGGSGTGKSVLLRSIIGLEFIDKGEILFKGSRIDNLSERELFKVRQKISYSFQSGALFDSLNVFENISYPLYEHTNLSDEQIKHKVLLLLKLIDLEGKEKLMPADLSGGMQKRVGMARSMILDPDIILYDEPTAGLDPKNTNNVVDIMSKLKDEGFSSIFVTHDIPSALQLCNRLIILKEGKIIFNDTPKEFEKSNHPDITAFKLSEGLKDAI